MVKRLVHGGNGKRNLRNTTRDTTRGSNNLTFPSARSAEAVGRVVGPGCGNCRIHSHSPASNEGERLSDRH
jgi:hypothetical protein